MHDDRPEEAAYVPRTQSVQLVILSMEYEPGRHTDALVSVHDDPAGHTVQLDEPAGAKRPGEHEVQMAWPEME